MIPIHKTLFISDLHLELDQPHITDQFLKLLISCDASVDALYILGDLFEAWIGDDDTTSFHQEIINALKTKTDNGLPIYFLPGNRDFLIGKKFLLASGCQLLGDEEVISLYGTNVLLMHGDTLCTLDVDYLKARKRLHNYFVRHFFLLLPLTVRKKIVSAVREKSENYKKVTPLEIMDVTQSEVIRRMNQHHVHHLIHGHTHRPAIHRSTINNEVLERIVLPAWHGHGGVLEWYANGEKKLIDLK